MTPGCCLGPWRSTGKGAVVRKPPSGSRDLVRGRRKWSSTGHADVRLLRGLRLSTSTLRVEGKGQNCAAGSEQKIEKFVQLVVYL